MLRLLDEGQVMVHLDPRREDVQVPGHLAQDPVLRLNVAYGFNLPSLEVDDEGIYAVLSFGGRDFGCWLPWPSVFALTLPDHDHQGSLWPEDMPDELDPLFSAIRHLKTGDEGGVSMDRPGRPGLSVIDGGAKPAIVENDGGVKPAALEIAEPAALAEEDTEEQPEEPPPTGGSHLRLVKG